MLLVNLSAKFLPKQAFKELEEAGIDLNKIMEVAKSGKDYTATTYVVESNTNITVILTLI